MKRRYLYMLMFSVPAFLFSAIFTVVLIAATTGVLWIFVFGDNEWPSFVNSAMSALMFVVFGLACLALLSAAHIWGKREETSAVLNKSHVFAAAGSSIGLVLLALLHQLSVGNIGPEHDSIVCSDFCISRNFNGSGTFPDGTCRCFGTDGGETLVSSLKQLRSESE